MKGRCLDKLVMYTPAVCHAAAHEMNLSPADLPCRTARTDVSSRPSWKLRQAALVLVFLLSPSAMAAAERYKSVRACNAQQQIAILNSMTACEVRDTLVDLKPVFGNISDVIQVIPRHVNVPRCGGSCHLGPHSCLPKRTKTRRVQVMLEMTNFPYGEHEVRCAETEVEEHLQCGCACQVTREDCRPSIQYYDPTSCRCLCSNVEGRNECVRSNREWDHNTCSCLCPVTRWQQCSTGYMFDYNSCECVMVSAFASKGVIAACVVLLAAALILATGGYLMFRHRLGPFREESAPPAPEKQRTRFMTQKSRSEYDLVSVHRGNQSQPMTIREFDKLRHMKNSEKDKALLMT